jgi:GH15 family glucan-1,4-alpha-glucosidase
MNRHTSENFRVLMLLLEHLEAIWQRPDEGIWETRGGREQFTYSKVMAWVAFDRAILIAKKLRVKAPLEKWEKIRDTIHEEICRKAYDKEKDTFVQFYGAKHVDASLLLIPIVGFLPPNDRRVRGTIEAVERELMSGGFVQRYDTTRLNDGLPPGEGVFLACSFWMVSALKSIGRIKDARALFNRLLALRNDLGLLSEEYDVERHRLVGNFPQAFSHIALINAAVDLEREDEHHHRARRHHAHAELAPRP